MPTDAEVTSLLTSTMNLINVEIQQAYLAYKAKFPSYDQSTSTLAELQNELDGLNRKKEELDRVEQTYDREFLDRVNSPPPAKGIFKQFGFVTTQDWVIALFLMAFFSFSICLILFFVVHSEAKLKAFGVAISIIIVLGFMLGLLIFKYV